MQRLFLMLAVVVMVISLGAAVWAANPQDVEVDWEVNGWIILWVPFGDREIALGTIDGSQYDPETEKLDCDN